MVTIYTTPSCPYCMRAKKLLNERNIPFSEIDVSVDSVARERASQQAHGYQTVPMIFVGDLFLGGYDDIARLDAQGELATLVSQQTV